MLTRETTLQAIANELSKLDSEDVCTVADLLYDGRGPYEPKISFMDNGTKAVVELNCATWIVTTTTATEI